MAKSRARRDEPSGGEATAGHHGNRTFGPVSEMVPCLVVRATPDGYVVGKALVLAADVEWLSPTHMRPWLETRPTDVRIPAMKQGAVGGQVELKPARTVKGVPVAKPVGMEVVFGEMLDAAAHRAKGELKRMFDAVVRGRRTYDRHLCKERLHDGLPEWLAVPSGEACAHCGWSKKAARAA